MTAQIDDTILYRKINFAITGIAGSSPFDPATLPFKPVSISTACHRGYIVHYLILDDRLYLIGLDLGLPNNQAIRARAGQGTKLFGVLPEFNGISAFLYKGFSTPMSFTGGLLLTDDFIPELYIHMGFHPAWKYRHIREVIFESGHRIEDHDRSAEMSALRIEIAKHWKSSEMIPRLKLQSELSNRMKMCFSRDYSKRNSRV